MKKLGLVLTSAFVFSMTVAAPALAKYPPEVLGGGGGAGGGSGGGGGETAFTGANISLGVALLSVLVIAGVVSLLVSRRKVTAAAE